MGWRDAMSKKLRRLSAAMDAHPLTLWLWSLLLAALISLSAVSGDRGLYYWAGLSLIYTILIWALSRLNFADLGRRPGHTRISDLVLFGVVVICNGLLTKGYQIVIANIHYPATDIFPQALGLGAPFAAAPLLAAYFLGRQAGFSMAVLSAFAAAIMWREPSFNMLIFHFIINLCAIYQLAGNTGRIKFIRAGLLSSLAAAPLVVGWAILSNTPLNTPLLSICIIAGPLSGVLATCLVPLLETLGYSTEDQLRSLASLDNPALRDLMLTAPGTYHHCLIVSSLVEAAARAIGADQLLGKTAALYHDLGKVKKPEYFVENKGSEFNRHDRLAPSMSALILISHVKDGVDLARKYRLPVAIQEIILQHHGTRVIAFFYNKACENARQAKSPKPAAEDFRYPGPRPQTREAGLVMLADIVEAASRALSHHTPSRLQSVIRQQISAAFIEGQLDECELTLKDLHNIARAFHSILGGIYHQRIGYPDERKEKEQDKNNADNHKQAEKLPPDGPADTPTPEKDIDLLAMPR
jgi:putative nucleotidyltransferase with HDIG domain